MRTTPRFLDLYALPSASGGVASSYVCIGLATPLDMKSKSYNPSCSYVLGIQVAVVASSGSNRGASQPRSIEWRDKGKAIDKVH
jgi:hypothetical protein